MTNLRTDEIAFSRSLTKIGTDENKAIYSNKNGILWIPEEQEMFVKHLCPFSKRMKIALTFGFSLVLLPTDLNINRDQSTHQGQHCIYLPILKPLGPIWQPGF